MNQLRSVGLLLMVLLLSSLIRVEAQQNDDSGIDRLEQSVVQIKSSSDGYGTGCIVGVTEDRVYIVTAAHVVGGDKHPSAEFAVAKGSVFPATVIGPILRELDLAVLEVDRSDKRLSSVMPLPPTSVPTLERGDILTIIGNPRQSPWSVSKRGVESIQGLRVVLDGNLEDGYSGAPLIKGRKMQGLVVSSDTVRSCAIPSDLIWLYLNSGILPKGVLQDATGAAEPEYVTAKKQLKDWGFDFTDRAFIDSVVGGQLKAVRLFLVANPAWARLPFDARVLVKGYTPSSNETSSSFAISALELAVMNDQVEVVRELIRAGGFNDTILSWDDVDLGTPLMIAAMNGNPEMVQILIEAGADVKKQDRNGNTPLTRATQMGKYPDIEEAFEDTSTGSIDTKNKDGYLKVAQILLKAGADANPETGYVSPIALAIENSSVDMLKILLDAGADVGSTLEAAIESKNKDMVRMVLARVKSVADDSALRSSVRNGDLDTVRLLLSKGALVNIKGALHPTALHLAIEQSNKDIMEYLISRGADVNAPCQHRVDAIGDVNGWTPLHQAAEKGNAIAAETLIAHGARVDAVAKYDSFGEAHALTPLAIAVQYGYKEVVAVLLRKKADAQVRGSIPQYASPALLHIAVAQHNLEIVRMLLKNGADPNVRCSMYGGYDQLTPLHLAAQNGDKEIVQALISARADANASASIMSDGKLYTGWSPLHFASRNGHTETIALLVEKGANVGALTSGGWTPLSLAESNKRYDAVNLLKRLCPVTKPIDLSGESETIDLFNTPVDPSNSLPPASGK